MAKFFIIGLPRSRTYWLSQFLGCLHEGIYYYPEYQNFMASDEVGDSTTAYPVIKDHIKGQKKVIIHRNIDEVKTSLTKLFGEHDWSFFDGVSSQLMDEDGLHVRFEDINDRLGEIWAYCHDEPYPKELADNMMPIILNNDSMIDEVRSCLG